MSSTDIRDYTTKERRELNGERYFLMQRVVRYLTREIELFELTQELEQIETSQEAAQ